MGGRTNAIQGVIIKMGLLCTLAVIGILLATWLVSRWDAKSAYRMLEHSQHFFKPEVDSPVDHVAPVKANIGNRDNRDNRDNRESSKRSSAGKRPYISPLVKKRVAARQKWRCAICKQLLDETFELDHRTPLFRGGHPTHESNLQALCKRCHLFKSAVSDRA